METNINNNIRIAAYCATSEAFDGKKSIFEAFKPIIITSIGDIVKSDNAQTVLFDVLKSKINELYPIGISASMLDRVLRLMKKDEQIIEYTRNNSIVVKNFKTVSNQLKSEKGELVLFFQGFCDFLGQKGILVSYEETKNELCNLIFARSSELADFLRTSKNGSQLAKNVDYTYILEFLDYLLLCEKEKPEEAVAFKQLFNGAVHASLLSINPNTVERVATQPFNIKKVILDTNYLIRILGLQTAVENKLARELWKTLRENGTELVVLPSSIKEIRSSVQKFISEYEPYTASTVLLKDHQIRCSGYLSAIRSGLISLTDLYKYTRSFEIENELKDTWHCNIVENGYRISDDDISEIISQINYDGNRPGYGRESAIQDLELIEYCKDCRKSEKTYRKSAQDSLIWVLTEDNRLCKYSEAKAEETKECISESQLSTLLYFTRQKSIGNALVDIVVSMATTRMATLEKFNSFVRKLSQYKEDAKDNPDKLDNVALLMAVDAITTDDINEVSDGVIEIDSLIDKRSEEIKRLLEKEREENKGNIQRVQDDLRREKTNVETIQEKNSYLQEEITDLRRNYETAKTEADLIKEEKEKYEIKQREKEKAQYSHDIKKLSEAIKRIDKDKRKVATKRYVLLYVIWLIILIIAGAVTYKRGYAWFIEELTKHPKVWDVLLTLLCGFLTAIFLVGPFVIPGIYRFCKDGKFSVNPIELIILYKKELAREVVKKEVKDYDWIWERIENAGGFDDMYEKGDGTSNILQFLVASRTSLGKEEE